MKRYAPRALSIRWTFAYLLAFVAAGSPVSAEPAADEGAGTPADENSAEFRIIVEAEVPEGFPTPGPAGEVHLKQYPAYRAARADGRGAFRVLFNHIQRHDIAMTTPVEMTLDTNADGEPLPRPTDMAFLYVDPELGDSGADPADGRVEVLDLPARSYLSYGFFGESEPTKVARALEKINAHLADHDTLSADGPARLMGYNSPFVPRALRYHEVQLPVKHHTDRETDTEAGG
ncbi:MAG: heme-binding protein [Planctomycetota bacterium]